MLAVEGKKFDLICRVLLEASNDASRGTAAIVADSIAVVSSTETHFTSEVS